jgi:hypothetical protein
LDTSRRVFSSGSVMMGRSVMPVQIVEAASPVN